MMFVIGLALIAGGVLVIIYAMQGESVFAFSPQTNGGEAAVHPVTPGEAAVRPLTPGEPRRR